MNVGIIGFGLMGQQRARAIAAIPPHRVTAVYDPNVDLIATAARFGCVLENSYQSLLERADVDMVVVAVPHACSRDIAIAALQAGKYVFCEKPLGMSLEDCDRILLAAGENGLPLGVGFNYRFYPGIQHARKMILAGQIGTPTHMRCAFGHGGRPGYEREWKTRKASCGGGALLDPGIHIIDLIRFLLGDIEDGAATLLRTYWHIDVEDNAFLELHLAGGAHAQVHISITEWKSKFAMDLFGSEGSIHVRGRSGFYGGQTVEFRPRWEWLDPERQPTHAVYAPEDFSFREELHAYFEKIEGHHRGDLASGEDGRSALAIIERLYRNTRSVAPLRTAASTAL